MKTTIQPASRFRDNYLLLILGYTALFVLSCAGLRLYGLFDVLPGNESLLHFDAGYYASIRDGGYEYLDGKNSNAGFFPLFAYWWRLLPLGPLGISAINGTLYLGSVYALCRLLRPGAIVLGLFMSLPFLFFVYTPLSESLYFVFATALLYGLVRGSGRLIFFSLLLAGLTRASFLFLVPALIGMTVMVQPGVKAIGRADWGKVAIRYLLPIVLATLVVACIQYVEVGEALAYYKTQAEGWGRQFGWPVLPFGSGHLDWLGHLTRTNFWLGSLVAGTGLFYLIQWLWRARLRPVISEVELLSIIYLTMSFLSILLFNPEWQWYMIGGHNVTYLRGINRYLQPTPFLLVFMVFLFRLRWVKAYGPAILLAATALLWFLVVPHYLQDPDEFTKVSSATALIIPYITYHYLRWRWLGIALIGWSFLLQAMMFQAFLANVHVD